MDPFFTNVKHKLDPSKKCVHEEDRYNGKIHSRLIIYKNFFKKKSGVIIPEWLFILIILFIIMLIVILIAAILLKILSKGPALYMQDCRGRSCFPGLSLKCIDNKCQCETGNYYETKCLKKKLVNEHCKNTNECVNSKGLICFNGICQCNKSYYWNVNSCSAKKSYGDICKKGECLDSVMLECNTAGICSCNSTRFWTGFGCMQKRTVNEICYSDDACLNSQLLTCIDGICSCDSNKTYYDYNLLSCVNYLQYGEFDCTLKNCLPGTSLICNVNSSSNSCNCPILSNDLMCDCLRIPGNESYWDLSLSRCVPALAENSACTNTYECLKGMVCNATTNTCLCPYTQYYNSTSSSCVSQTLNNTVCIANSTCRADLGLSCQSGSCQCNTITQFWFNDSVGCVEKLSINFSCFADNNCKSEKGLYCFGGLCQCNANTQFWHNDSTGCRNYLTYGESTCNSNLQCNTSAGLFCNLNPANNTCNCPNISTYGMCDCPYSLNWDCQSSAINEYYWDYSSSSCKPAINDGSSCSFDYQCRKPFNCTSSTCSFSNSYQGPCASGWHYFMGKCYSHISGQTYTNYVLSCTTTTPPSSATIINHITTLKWLFEWQSHTYVGNYSCCAIPTLPTVPFYPILDNGCVEDHSISTHTHGGFCEYTP